MKNNNNTSLLKEIRDARTSASSAFIEFTSCHNLYKNYVFCFYEGEDGKYYNQKIKNIIGENIYTIIVGNKNEVLKLWRRIKSDSVYSSVHKMFFVDRDMDDIPSDKDADLYITPCYSIENLYVNKYCVSNIIESEFSINKAEEDHKKSIELFKKMLTEFNDIMLDFNSLVYLKAKKNINCDGISASDIKTNQLVSINDGKVELHKNHLNMIEKYKSSLKISNEELHQGKEELKMIGDYNNTFRGKNQFYFLIKFINYLKLLHNNGDFFCRKRKAVKIVIDNNGLSQLSQYAVFPDDLIKFIVYHKIN